MKRLLFCALALTLALGLTPCARAEAPSAAQDAPTSRRILIAYFSRAGENYNVGTPDPESASAAYAGYIDKGNTAIMAEIIAELTGGTLFEIAPVTPYPADYAGMLAAAEREAREGAMPEIADAVEHFDEYDAVFVGYPIWNGDLPAIVYHFLGSYDFAGKTVIPFNTHEGSGQAGTQRTIETLLPDAAVLDGLALRGATAQNDREAAEEAVREWLDGLQLDKTEEK